MKSILSRTRNLNNICYIIKFWGEGAVLNTSPFPYTICCFMLLYWMLIVFMFYPYSKEIWLKIRVLNPYLWCKVCITWLIYFQRKLNYFINFSEALLSDFVCGCSGWCHSRWYISFLIGKGCMVGKAMMPCGLWFHIVLCGLRGGTGITTHLMECRELWLKFSLFFVHSLFEWCKMSDRVSCSSLVGFMDHLSLHL